MCMYAYVHTCMCACRGTLLCLQIVLHPPAPPSWSQRSPNRKNSIKCEWIKIFEFCLNICDPWALLHTYRVGLICRWGGVLSQMALLCFKPKKVHVFYSCDSVDKNFAIFALDPTRPCLDWQLNKFLTSQAITTLSSLTSNEDQSAKYDLNVNFPTVEKFKMHP